MLIDRERARTILQDAVKLYKDDIIGWQDNDPKSYARVLEEYVRGEMGFHLSEEDYHLFCDILNLLQMVWQAEPPQLVDYLQEIGLIDNVVVEEVIDYNLPKCGTVQRYRHSKHPCRCPDCRKAWAAYIKERRQEKKKCEPDSSTS